MKRYSVLLVTVFMAVAGAEAQTGKTEGYLRLGIEHHDQGSSTSDTALGGMLKYTTAKYHGISSGAGFYTVQGVGSRENAGIPFYDNDNHNYSLLGELYLQGNFGNTTVTIGRQVIDTPFADSDDIGMVPNLFEAYTIENHDLKDTTLIFSHITKMAGVGAPDASRFSKVNGSDGVQTLGLLYEGVQNTTLSGWYYHAHGLADMAYLEGSYEGRYSAGSWQIGAQYALQDHENGERANIYGVTAQLSHETSGMSIVGAYNKVNSRKNATADNFLGGGPFFTSDEHLTLAEAGVDGKAYLTGLTYDFTAAGVEGMTLSVNALYLQGKNAKADELDWVLNYTPDEKTSVDLIYSDAKDRKDRSGSFKNLRIFVNYRF